MHKHKTFNTINLNFYSNASLNNSLPSVSGLSGWAYQYREAEYQSNLPKGKLFLRYFPHNPVSFWLPMFIFRQCRARLKVHRPAPSPLQRMNKIRVTLQIPQKCQKLTRVKFLASIEVINTGLNPRSGRHLTGELRNACIYSMRPSLNFISSFKSVLI